MNKHLKHTTVANSASVNLGSKEHQEQPEVNNGTCASSSRVVKPTKGGRKPLSLFNKWLISAILTVPLLYDMIFTGIFGALPGGNITLLILTTPVMIIGGSTFIEGAWAALKNHKANMDTLVAFGTLTTFFYSIYAMFIGAEVYFEIAALLIVFILLGQVLEELTKGRASQAVGKLLELQAKDALVIRNGKEVRIPSTDLRVGDVIIVKPGEKIPTDGKVLEGESYVDESLVTGESKPVLKKSASAVIGASINTTGSFRFTATKIGSDTLLAQIVELVRQAQNSKAPIQKLVDRVSNFFVPTVLIISIITFDIWFLLLGASFAVALLFAVAVVVIACPCALGLATPTALMVGVGLGAKNGILIKSGEVLEKGRAIKTIVFDKTGTITEGHPKVTDVIGDKSKALQIAASLEKKSEHPLAIAVLDASVKIKLKEVNNFVAHEGKGISGNIDGKKGFVGTIGLLEDNSVSISNQVKTQWHQMQAEAKTVVGVAYDKKFLGLVGIQDAPKATSKQAISTLKEHGYNTIMLTGDNLATAEAIAKEVGIDRVVAEVLPHDKATKIKELQEEHPVGFVGDGINDAPALASAHLGIAMGSGTDVAIESGDIVLVKDDLGDVARALGLSKKTFNRIRINLFWAFIYNFSGIPIAAGLFSSFGLILNPALAGLAMAFSSVSVVLSSLLLNKTNVRDV